MNADDGVGPDFDTLLGHELRRQIGSLQGPCPDAPRATYRAVAARRRHTMPLLSALVAAAVVAGGGTVAAAAATGSADPATWGRTVTEAVATCRSQLGEDQHGIGQCVSAVARKHGESQRDAHRAGEQSQPEHTPGPHPTQQGGAHQNGAASEHPNGRPSAAPVGPPASPPPASGGNHPTGPPVSPPAPSPRHQ
jgi:hypothetical protein